MGPIRRAPFTLIIGHDPVVLTCEFLRMSNEGREPLYLPQSRDWLSAVSPDALDRLHEKPRWVERGWVHFVERTQSADGVTVMQTDTPALALSLCSNGGLPFSLHRALMYMERLGHRGLVIEEPMLMLHPKHHAYVLETLAIVANLGIHVAFTTYSPYAMMHLQTLTQEVPASHRTQCAAHLLRKDARAFLDPANVAAYAMDDNHEAIPLEDPSHGYRWDTLSDVSGDLQSLYMTIAEEVYPTKETP